MENMENCRLGPAPQRKVTYVALGRCKKLLPLAALSQLLLAAGRRCLRVAEEIGGTAMLIDAKNEQVATWYASYGALPLLDAPLTLLLPLNLVAAAIKAAGKSP